MKRLTGLAMGAAVLFCSLGAFGQHGGQRRSRRRAWWHCRYQRLRLRRISITPSRFKRLQTRSPSFKEWRSGRRPRASRRRSFFSWRQRPIVRLIFPGKQQP